MRLFLVRHGQTAWNADMRAQGHTDIALDEVGEMQAMQLGQASTGIGIARIVTSDLKRAASTAQAIADSVKVPLNTDEALRERSFGKYEGMKFAELSACLSQQRHIEGVDEYDVRPPKGESLRDAWHRLQPFAKSLFTESQNTLVVAHGASCSLLLAHLVKGSIETSRAFRFGNASLTELIRRPEGIFQILRYNDTSHLTTHQPLVGTIDGASR